MPKDAPPGMHPAGLLHIWKMRRAARDDFFQIDSMSSGAALQDMPAWILETSSCEVFFFSLSFLFPLLHVGEGTA